MDTSSQPISNTRTSFIATSPLAPNAKPVASRRPFPSRGVTDNTREMRRLEVKNRHLKQILDNLHQSIFLGEATQHMQLNPPGDNQLLTELTVKTNKIHSRFCELKAELDDIHRTISQLTSMIVGDNTNILTTTGRQPRRNPERKIDQRENSSTIYKAIELVRSAWLKKEKDLSASKQELENKIKDYEHRLRPQSSGPGLLRGSVKGEEPVPIKVVERRETKLAWGNENLELEKEKANLIRLSTIDDIPDLSDADRPTKLGQVYTELYEHVFTGAVDELTRDDTITENDAFMILLNILMSSFQNCREMTWGRYEKLTNVASSLDIEQGSSLSSAKIAVKDNLESSHSSATGESNDNFERDEEKHLKCTIDLNFDLMQAIKDIWRKTTLEMKEIAAETLYSVIETCLDMPFDVQLMTSTYLKRCIDLCWKMGVQEKPLHLDGFAEMEAYAGKKFDKDKFDAHARSGSHVAFVVWPTLYLYEGGPILAKGIAQCCSPDETENEKSS